MLSGLCGTKWLYSMTACKYYIVYPNFVCRKLKENSYSEKSTVTNLFILLWDDGREQVHLVLRPLATSSLSNLSGGNEHKNGTMICKSEMNLYY